MLLRLSVLLLSSSVLCYEIVIIRLLTISHWQPFVTLAISVALLGFGISGSVLVRTGGFLFPRRHVCYPLFAALAALSYRPMLAAAGLLRLEPALIVRDLEQWATLALLVVTLTLPFLLASLALALPLLERETVGRYYGWNLTGSCLGALMALAALALLPPGALAGVPTAAAAAACAVSLPHYHRLSRPYDMVILATAILLPTLLIPFGPVRYGPYKDISYALLLPGSRISAREGGVTGLIQAVQAPAIRSAAGLSTGYPGQLPPQGALFRDGDRIGTLVLADDVADTRLEYVRWQTGAAAYEMLTPGAEVAVVGFDGGEEMVRSLVYGASRVAVAEADPVAQRMAGSTPEVFKEWIFFHPGVSLVTSNIRSFLVSAPGRFDAVIFPASGNLAAAAAGLTGTAESYELTHEGIGAALEALREGGLVAISGWNQEPPTARLKILAVLRDLAGDLNESWYPEGVAVIEGWSTHTVIVRRTALSAGDLDALAAFCRSRAFSLVRKWDLGDGEGRMLGERNVGGLEGYDLRPPVDDRPFPWHSMKVSQLGRMAGRRGEAAFLKVEWGFLFLIMTLVLSVALSLVLLALSRPANRSSAARWPFTLYFSSLGIGYMVIEVMTIKRGGLVLAPPAVSAALVLAGFLLFSGLGSLTAGKLHRRTGHVPMLFPFIPIAAAGIYFLMPHLVQLATPIRVIMVLVLLAPCAYLMGFPFPAALGGFRTRRESLVPWAWAASGYTSVLGSSLAGVLAITGGLFVLLLLGAACYVLAAILFPRVARE